VGLVSGRWPWCIGAGLLVLAAGVAPLGLKLADLRDVEVRAIPWRTHGGRLQGASPVGQGFRCRWDGLDRIEVALVALGPTRDAELELVLRDGARDGPVLRTVRADAAQPAGSRPWLAFDFEPLPDSAGRALWFELRPADGAQDSPWSTWTRYHGQPGVDAPWGDRVLAGRVFEGDVIDNSLPPQKLHFWSKVPHPHLSAMAFAVEELRPAEGAVLLELWDAGGDPASDPPLRRSRLAPGAGVEGGYAFFHFEPIAASRWKDMRFRLTAPEGARMIGFEKGLSFKTLHGGDPGPPALIGMARGDEVHTDCSLIFRAHSSPARSEVLRLLLDRLDGRLAGAALCWILGTLLILGLVRPR